MAGAGDSGITSLVKGHGRQCKHMKGTVHIVCRKYICGERANIKGRA